MSPRVNRPVIASRLAGLRLPPTANVGLVAVGGALGAVARVMVAVAVPAPTDSWPWATFAANVSGALLLGLLWGAIRDGAVVGWWVRPLVGTGIIGGYTTFSTASLETLQLAVGGRALTATGYALAGTAGGLAAVWLGTVGALAARRVRSGGR